MFCYKKDNKLINKVYKGALRAIHGMLMFNISQDIMNIHAFNAHVVPDLKSIKEKVVDQEDRSRRNNLRVSGIPEDKDEDWSSTKEKCRQFLKTS